MTRYLGETTVEIKDSPFAEYTPTDWVMKYIKRYGQIQGEYHKEWVLDQIARILNDAPITLTLAKWDNGDAEWRYDVGSSKKYLEWVDKMKGKKIIDSDGFEYDEYEYHEGVAP